MNSSSSFPDELEQGTIYVSIRFATASHLCCCGCGNKVVTPIRPTDWKLIFDGKTISLDPSIGNWSFRVPVPLLDKEQQGSMGGSVVPGRDCCRKSP